MYLYKDVQGPELTLSSGYDGSPCYIAGKVDMLDYPRTSFIFDGCSDNNGCCCCNTRGGLHFGFGSRLHTLPGFGPCLSRHEVKIVDRVLPPCSYLLNCSVDRRYKIRSCRATYSLQTYHPLRQDVSEIVTQHCRISSASRRTTRCDTRS